jgi:hypothetical protein
MTEKKMSEKQAEFKQKVIELIDASVEFNNAVYKAFGCVMPRSLEPASTRQVLALVALAEFDKKEGKK